MFLSFLFSNIFDLAFILTYSAIFILLPSLLLLSAVKIPTLEKYTISAIAGFSIYSLISYTVRFFNLPYLLIEFILTLFLISQRKSFPKFYPPSKLDPILIAILIFSALIHSAVLVRSAIPAVDGTSFINLSFHDSMQHISIIKSLYHSSTISHPGFSGATLTNYHYLIDQSLASLTRFSFINLYNVYYRIYPILISILFSLIVFASAKQFTKHKFIPHLSILFVLFSANASFFYQFFRGPEYSWGSNSFMINPIIDLLQNPASIFALAQVLTLAYIINTHSRHLYHPRLLFILTIISGTTIGFKAWGGLLIHFALGALIIYQMIRSRSVNLIIPTTISVLISLWIFLPHYNSTTSASPVWAPGWTLERMVNDADRYNNLDDLFRLQYYQRTSNQFRVVYMYTKWFFIYLIGNYWLRIAGFLVITSWLFNSRKLTNLKVYILAITFPSLLLPIFFNQGRMAYDIEQFSPYAIVFSAIITISFFSNLLRNQIVKTRTVYSLIIFIILISSASNYTSIKARVFSETTLIPTSLIEAYNQVTQLTSPDDIILLAPSHRNISTLQFPAFTNRNTFYSGRTLSVITGDNFESRQKLLEETFGNQDPNRFNQLVGDHNVTHLFLDSEDRDNYPKFHVSDKIIFSNNSATLYRL